MTGVSLGLFFLIIGTLSLWGAIKKDLFTKFMRMTFASLALTFISAGAAQIHETVSPEREVSQASNLVDPIAAFQRASNRK